jgi:hypothetical protein
VISDNEANTEIVSYLATVISVRIIFQLMMMMMIVIIFDVVSLKPLGLVRTTDSIPEVLKVGSCIKKRGQAFLHDLTLCVNFVLRRHTNSARSLLSDFCVPFEFDPYHGQCVRTRPI